MKFRITNLCHYSEIRGLCSTKCSSKMLQNFSYFVCKKTHVHFFPFWFDATLYFYLLNVHIDHSIKKIKKCTIWKMKKNTWSFLNIKYSKWCILLKHLCWAQTSYLWRVIYSSQKITYRLMLWNLEFRSFYYVFWFDLSDDLFLLLLWHLIHLKELYISTLK